MVRYGDRGASVSRGTRLCRFGLLSALSLVAWALPAAAQWQIDFYMGAPFYRSEDIEVVGESATAPIIFGDLDDSGELAVGGRGGYWFEIAGPIDIGTFVDASAVFGEVGHADFDFVPVSGLLLARMRLMESEQFPQGRLQPYLGGGPSVVWSTVDVGLWDDTQVDIGGDVRAGLNFVLVDGLGIFGEYRYTYFEPSYDSSIDGLDESAKFDLKSSTHHLNFGLSWGF